jgi:hypothetical protein
MMNICQTRETEMENSEGMREKLYDMKKGLGDLKS